MSLYCHDIPALHSLHFPHLIFVPHRPEPSPFKVVPRHPGPQSLKPRHQIYTRGHMPVPGNKAPIPHPSKSVFVVVFTK